MIFPLAREDKTVKNGEDTHIPRPVQWYVYPSASATIFHLCMLFHPCPKPSWVDSLTKCPVQFLRMYLKKKNNHLLPREPPFLLLCRGWGISVYCILSYQGYTYHQSCVRDIHISREYTYHHDTATMFDVCERLLPHRANVVYTLLDRITFLALISLLSLHILRVTNLRLFIAML